QLVEPVGTRASEAIEVEWTDACKCVGAKFIFLQRPIEQPTMVRRIEVMRRDEHGIVTGLGGSEDLGEVLDCSIFNHTVAQDIPVSTRRTEDIVLWVDNDAR